MKSAIRTLLLPLILVVAAGSLASCDWRGKTVRLGASACLTGPEATLGQSSRNGYLLAVEEWNARGGVLHKPVKLIVADDKADPGEGATIFTKFIERDQVAGILGPTLSKVALAGAPIAQAAGVPMLTPTSTNPKVTAVGDCIFRACFTDAQQGGVGGAFAFDDLKARRAACLFDLGNDYAVGLAEAFRAAFQQRGGMMVGFEAHGTGVMDFKAQLTKILAGKPDLLYVSDYYNDVALIARQARELGFRGTFLGGDGWDSPELLRLGGAALEGACYTTHCSKDDPDPAVRAFVQQYQAKYKADPDSLAILAYDGCNLLLDAIQRAGTAERPAIKAALVRANLRAVSGQIHFDAHRNPLKAIAILELRGGRPALRAKVTPPAA
jgi:branched-chain amino acid transport system substrate-binding protein